MGRGKDFTTTELEEIRGFIKDGLTYAEVAELMGRTTKAISNIAHRKGFTYSSFGIPHRNQYTKDVTVTKPEPVTVSKTEPVTAVPSVLIREPVKEKTLEDFSARDMIRHLYKLGYRIEDNKLVCLVKQTVNVKDIING